ncbi:hypothetical protein SAMN04489864_103142 [Pedobacter insulae]|uniref:Uncharacterized protein n=1 Tax=Pedobacter insulae TaxID=414048 RepID=A0A1I2VN95_9SPHI|nr:hypothetical protein SAMN04489864_103142 [Pedobacter insulae]
MVMTYIILVISISYFTIVIYLTLLDGRLKKS